MPYKFHIFLPQSRTYYYYVFLLCIPPYVHIPIMIIVRTQLGLQNFLNQALLAKWIWQIYEEKDALRRRAIAAKNGTSYLSHKPGHSLILSSQGPWRFIRKQQELSIAATFAK